MDDILNFDTEQCLDMFDSLSRINSARQIKPLDQFNYINYDHRYYYDGCNLLIGDVFIMVPPEFIYVASESFSQNVQTLRQENSQKEKTGYHKRTIKIDLIFDGPDEINGYKVPGPTHKDGEEISNYYYVDGLRTLFAQFKYTPFLPVKNELLNEAFNIYTVALQSIVVETLVGFQNVLVAHLSLQEVEMMPYIEMPNIMYQYTIDWDLFRHYTQSFLTEKHIYKKLQSLPLNKDHTGFKLSILNDDVFQTVEKDSNGNVKGAHSLEDKKGPSNKELKEMAKDPNYKPNSTSREKTILERVINPDNYTCIIDSNDSDVYISNFQFSYSNMLTSIQMSDCPSPTLQYLGGLDTFFRISFETSDIKVVGSIEQCQIQNDLMVRSNPKIRGSIGFVKIESDFVAFAGSLFCTVESVETNTVPGIPGLYNIVLSCVAYDIAQSEREELNGFMPFDGMRSYVSDINRSEGNSNFGALSDMMEFTSGLNRFVGNTALSEYMDNARKNLLFTSNEVDILRDPSRIAAVNGKQAISQSYEGLMKKIAQDNYAEWKLRTTMEVYPDLRLPTYDEINEAISNINAFRRSNGIEPLPYNDYPVQESNMIFGTKKQYNDLNNDWLDAGGNNVIYGGSIPNSVKTFYDGYLDPDFYVFYPNSYMSLYKEEQQYKNNKTQSTGVQDNSIYKSPTETNSTSRNISRDIDSSTQSGNDTDSKISKFIQTLRSQTGCHYAPCAEGEVQDYNGNMYDNPGLITFALKRCGVLPDNFQRLSYKDFDRLTDVFQEVPVKDLTRGDIIVNNAKNDCCTCLGYDKNNNIAVIKVDQINNVHEESLFYEPGHAYRIIPLQNKKIQGTKQSNPYVSDGNKYPDENGNIQQKAPTALETTQGYNSANPYGDDSSDSRGYNNTIEQNVDLKTKFEAKEGVGDELTGRTVTNTISNTSTSTSTSSSSSGNGFNLSFNKNNKSSYNSYATYLGRKEYYPEGKNKEDLLVSNAKNNGANYTNISKLNNDSSTTTTDTNTTTNTTIVEDNKVKFDTNNYMVTASGSSQTGFALTNTDQIKMNEYDRRNRSATGEQLEEATKKPELNQADISNLTIPPIKDDGSNWTDGSVKLTDTKEMSTDEFNSIALTIANECAGEKFACKMAMAQYIYDKAYMSFNGNGLTAVLRNDFFKDDKESVESNDMAEAKNAVQRVFQSGVRWKKNYKVLGYTSVSNSNLGNSNREDRYDKIETVGQHTFYGSYIQNTGREYAYNIQGYGVTESSRNGTTVTETKNINGVKYSNTKNFGKPIYIKPNHFDSHDNNIGKEWQNLNNNLNRLNTSFVDECQYSAKGRLVKAFPTFLFCILDDQAQWYDGKKLWTNYYTYKPVVNISYHAANDMPIETAEITVTNTYHNLDRESSDITNYSISEDKDYDVVNRFLYKNFGIILGGLKITDRIIQMHSILFEHTKVREGARVHLRIGYGSDPLSLAPIMNGTISGMTLGDQINISITSDGHELIQNITSDKSKDLNCGALGLFGLGANRHGADIISEIMVKRQSWINHLFFGAFSSWFEGSKYNIEHFGLYIAHGEQYLLQGGIDVAKYEQYDLLMNVYHAVLEDELFGFVKLKHWNYMYYTSVLGSVDILKLFDGQCNIVFNQYNMTPWDVFQMCAQTAPEYIVKPERYQFDSRLYFGLPFDLTKYRYDIINDTVYQECKANTQMHYIDSITSIIENQVSVSSRRSNTNAKVIYTRGKSPKPTPIIHSDDTIDNSQQKTTIIDSCVTQDYFGPDMIYELVGIRDGKNTARRLGISNLLYGWQQQYNGQLICLGAPQIKPDDYIMVNDFYTSLNGLAMVREVIHTFNNTTGFTTSVIPGIIGFCPEVDSGNISLIASFLKLFSIFTQFSESRREIKNYYEKMSRQVALIDAVDFQQKIMDIGLKNMGKNAINGITTASGIARGFANAHLTYQAIRTIRFLGVVDTLKLIRDTLKVYQTTQKGLAFMRSINNIKGILQALTTLQRLEKAGEGAKLALLGAKFHPVGFIIMTIIDVALNCITDWLTNRNVCILLPLWWEGEPFVSGVKDGEKILLIPSSSTGSNENTGEDGMETDEDEISVTEN